MNCLGTKFLCQPFRFATRLITCGEYMAFMADRGYQRPELWLSEGWDAVQANHWVAPLYWEKSGNDWYQFTCSGLRPVEENEPVCHVSLFEADAFARWAGARLPTEAEWEIVAASVPVRGQSAGKRRFSPAACRARRSATAHCRFLATCGNGPAAPTFLIPVSNRQPEHWANTTANS